MKVIFFANGAFSIPSLQSLIDFDFNVLAVITNTDKLGGRGKKKLETDVSIFAKSSNLLCIKTDNLNSLEIYNKIKSFNADVFIVISYKIIPKEIFSIPLYGTVNIHASILPNYRGAAPIQRSIINGDNRLGLTSFLINDKIDSGKIINNIAYDINDKMTYGQSHDILANKSGPFLIKSLKNLRSKKYLKSDNLKVTYANKILKSEYKISLDNSSFVVHNQFRGLTPPGPYLLFNHKRVKLFDTYYYNTNNLNIKRGSWIVENNLLLIGCDSGVLTTKMIQFSGKNIISIKDFNNMNHSNLSVFN
jgi:methionyl-tRNA formyltransferase